MPRSPDSYCSTGSKARSEVWGSIPSAGRSPVPRSGGCRLREGARTASGRSESCPHGSVATLAEVRSQGAPLARIRPASMHSPPNDEITAIATLFLHGTRPPSRRTGIHTVDDLPVELREPQRLVEGARAGVVVVRHPLDPAASRTCGGQGAELVHEAGADALAAEGAADIELFQEERVGGAAAGQRNE